MSQSAEDALKALRNKIVDSIEETEKQYAIDKGNFITIHEFFIAISECYRIVRIIDNMLDKLEKVEKHTHKWKYRKDFQYYYCDGCDIALYPNQVEEYLNKWQEQLDRAQERFHPNVD